MLRVLTMAATAAGLSASALAQDIEVKREGPVTLPTAQQLVLHSKTLGRDVMVRIAPPAAPVPAGGKAAAVYLLDGNISFGLASDTLRLMALEGETWPTYLISIGYDTTDPRQVMASREIDYLHATHTQPGDSTPNGGGGAVFETFIVQELKPFIESRLAADPARSFLGGHSYGGLFVANVAARRPDAFAGYMIGSPSVWAHPEVVSDAANAKGGSRPVFLAVGELEKSADIDMVTDAAKLGDALEAGGFAVTERVNLGQTHGMEPNVWLAEGLRAILKRPRS